MSGNPDNSLNGMQWGGMSLVFAGILGDVARKLNAPAKKVEKKEVSQ